MVWNLLNSTWSIMNLLFRSLVNSRGPLSLGELGRFHRNIKRMKTNIDSLTRFTRILCIGSVCNNSWILERNKHSHLRRWSRRLKRIWPL